MSHDCCSFVSKFRYKRRVYTQSYVDDKQLAKLHTKVYKHAQNNTHVKGQVDNDFQFKIPLFCKIADWV